MPRPLAVLCLALAAGCSAPADDPCPVPIAPAEDLRLAAAGNNAFTFDLYGRVAATVEGNAVVSPFSVRTALGMTSLGARGATAESLRKLLHFGPLEGAQLHRALGSLPWSLSAGRDEPYEFAAASALWPQSGLALRPEFASAAKSYYGATVEPLNFAGAPEAARGRINQWTAGRTRGRVPELLKPGVLGADTALVLTNAAAFKGKWQTPFERASTRPGEFTTATGETVTVPTMSASRLKCEMSSARDGPTWLRLPYRGGRVGMVLGLPAKGQSAPALLAGLAPEALVAVLGGVRPTERDVRLPKFRFTSDFPLLGPLTEMGLVNADYSGIAGGVGVVGAVAHAATIEVNEEGTVAAAATAVTVKSIAMPPVAFDRPFVFLIHNAATGAVLFCGHVNDPR